MAEKAVEDFCNTYVVSHELSSSLPLLSVRHTVTLPTSELHSHWPIPIYTAWWTEARLWTSCLGSLRDSRTAADWTGDLQWHHATFWVQY